LFHGRVVVVEGDGRVVVPIRDRDSVVVVYDEDRIDVLIRNGDWYFFLRVDENCSMFAVVDEEVFFFVKLDR
jgi:hypothetical protein